MFVANRVREEKMPESEIQRKLAALDAAMEERSKWNLRAYASWYVHHEFTFHDECPKNFLQPLIPDGHLGFVLEMYMAPPLGQGLLLNECQSSYADCSDSP